MTPFTSTLPLPIAIIEMDDVRVNDSDAGWRELTACGDRYRAQAEARGSTAAGEVEGVQVARELFRMLGIDPTRRRPSSESLLRRALKGQPLPNINTLVDVGNWCSLDALLPLGLYDRGAIDGAVTLRVGEPGESYAALGDKTINLEGRYLLADETGPFGSPMTDSVRTAAGARTTEAVVFVYAPPDFDVDRFAEITRTMAARFEEHCACRITRSEVLT